MPFILLFCYITTQYTQYKSTDKYKLIEKYEIEWFSSFLGLITKN